MRILLADANADVLTALRLVLEQPGLCQPRNLLVAGEAHDAISLVAQVARNCLAHSCPDVVFLDADLPGLQLPRRMTGISPGQASPTSLAELVETLHLLCPDIRVVALSSRPNAEKECVQARVDAFVCKSDPPDALLILLRDILGMGRMEP